MKIKFEADIDDSIVREVKYWNLPMDDIVKDAMEHSILGSIRRRTDNLCRKCKKPVASSIPKDKKASISDYCRCS